LSVYSVRLGYATVTPSGAILFTVPSGRTVVVRDIEASNSGSATSSLNVALVVSGSGNVGNVLVLQNVAAGAHTQWEGRLVLNAGDELAAGATAGSFFLVVSGYSLID
jgi:hypothetical protein